MFSAGERSEPPQVQSDTNRLSNIKPVATLLSHHGLSSRGRTHVDSRFQETFVCMTSRTSRLSSIKPDVVISLLKFPFMHNKLASWCASPCCH